MKTFLQKEVGLIAQTIRNGYFHPQELKDAFLKGRRKLAKKIASEIISKRKAREIARFDSAKKTLLQNVLTYLRRELSEGKSSYSKVFIIGNKHIYLASPYYGHGDYNKSIICENTPENWFICEKANNVLERKWKSDDLEGLLIDYLANNENSESICDYLGVFGEKREDVKYLLVECYHDFHAVKIDDDGASNEQEKEMDEIIKKCISDIRKIS